MIRKGKGQTCTSYNMIVELLDTLHSDVVMVVLGVSCREILLVACMSLALK